MNQPVKKKLPLEYVLKNIPAKFGDDPSILRQRKLEIMNLTVTFFHWLILGPIGLKRTQIFFRSIEENHRLKRCALRGSDI